MHVVCLGLLLLRLAWAEPAGQPQTEKTKQDCVEEQRITYKGHHEKHGYYSFKYVYTSPGRKNQTNVKMKEERNKDNIASDHSGKRRNQEPALKENIAHEREEDLFHQEVDKSRQRSKSLNPFETRPTINEDYSISHRENAPNDLKMPLYPEPTGNDGPEDGGDVLSKPHDQEEYGAALTRNHMQHMTVPGTATERLGEENKDIKLRNVLSKLPASANHAKAKGKKNRQRDPQAPNIPVKSKSAHHTQHSTDHLKQVPRLGKGPSDSEGSGDPDLQGRGDDLAPFSGDGQPFKDASGKGDATGPDLAGADIQTGLWGPGEAGTEHPEAGGPGCNDIPEKAGDGGNSAGTAGETAQEADTAEVSLGEGTNDITVITNFKELPGKEGNRVDTGGQNAHQGTVEIHYPPVSSKEQRKEGSREVAESTNYNEIPKNGKGSSRKGTGHSDRNQVTSSEKQRFPSKGKSPGQFIPPHGLDNEIKNEIGSPSGPDNEGTKATHGGRDHKVPHRQDYSRWGKGTPQRKGFWAHGKSHSNRRLRPPRKHDSSESSYSGTSSESDGD